MISERLDYGEIEVYTTGMCILRRVKCSGEAGVTTVRDQAEK
jgi:hypothetical protein